ncbi:hypothetical protein CPter91_4726 [Collimonas pratensis]|uniref:Uncharacterized protein n=1 Tax=Collimonas pratensis TaxID=279113 RepID=A0A127QAZ5_9BURK|nr:hypothetical protein CPter91_4726 [Collimonas pratensis]
MKIISYFFPDLGYLSSSTLARRITVTPGATWRNGTERAHDEGNAEYADTEQ